jgi:adenylyltransferase/sulfurtransferase
MVRQIGVAELAQKIEDGASLFLLDVRQPWEHETAALAGSVLLPLDELTQRAEELEVPEGATVVAYCHHGVRSLSAVVILERLGHPDVVSLRGGIDAWAREVDAAMKRY